MRSWRPLALPALLALLGCEGAPAAPVAPVAVVAAPSPGAVPEIVPTRRVTISAAGDLVLNELAMRAVRAHATEDDGYRALLDGYARSIRAHDIAYLNLEMPLVDDVVALDPGWPRSLTERPRRSPVLGATPALAGVLASLGVDVVGVANNHAYDQGHAGLSRTLAALDAASLARVGAGASEDEAAAPLVIERGGVRVAWLACTTSLNQRARDAPRAHVAHVARWDRIEQALASARSGADVVVVAVHWSTDFVMRADAEQRSLAARLIEAGADVIVGTGPHVLHQVARTTSARGDALIAYSLGNLASGMGRTYRVGHPPDREEAIHPANVSPEARDGLVLRVTVVVHDGAIEIESVEGVPLWTTNDFLTRAPGEEPTVRVVPLGEAERPVQDEREPAIRAAVGAEVTLAPP